MHNNNHRINPQEFYALYNTFKRRISRLKGQDVVAVLTHLLSIEGKEVSVSQIQEATGKAQANVSGALAHLRALYLVRMRADGKRRFYAINTDQMQALLLFMAGPHKLEAV